MVNDQARLTGTLSTEPTKRTSYTVCGCSTASGMMAATEGVPISLSFSAFKSLVVTKVFFLSGYVCAYTNEFDLFARIIADRGTVP